MKKFFSLFLVLIVLASTSISAYGSESTSNLGITSSFRIQEFEKITFLEGLTFEEMIRDKQINGIALGKKERFFLNQASLGSYPSSKVRYYKVTMDEYSVSKFFSKYVLTPTFYVGLLFSLPNYSPERMISVTDGQVSTSSGQPCVFSGNVFYRLETGRQFYYGVYGNVYDEGRMTFGGGGLVKLGQSATANFWASYSNHFIQNVDFDGRFYSADLIP